MNPRDPDPVKEHLADLERRRASHRRWFYRHRPKRIGNVIAQLVQRRGYAQVRTADKRDQAWRTAVGAEWAASTRVGGIRRGTFEVLVANSLLMQELTFRKEQLLVSLQAALPEAGIQQIRFRIGKMA